MEVNQSPEFEEHYAFAFQTLPVWVTLAPNALRIDIEQGTISRRFAKLWPNANLDHKLVELNTGTAVALKAYLIILPEPSQPPLAHFACFTLESRPRYFTLEMTDGQTTILGEWIVERRGCLTRLLAGLLIPFRRDRGPRIAHINFGPGPAPNPHEFVESVTRILAGDIEPHSLLQLPG